MKTLFIADQFLPTKWDTAKQKAKFANHFVRFVESEFKPTLFYDWFYKQLSLTFGHIAHYNRAGFYEMFFKSPRGRLEFAEITLKGGYGSDPAYTYSDVESALKRWALETDLSGRCARDLSTAVEISERLELERLQVKYGKEAA